MLLDPTQITIWKEYFLRYDNTSCEKMQENLIHEENAFYMGRKKELTKGIVDNYKELLKK